MTAWIVLVGLLLIAGVAFGVSVYLERRKPRAKPSKRRQLRYPVVLAHGVLGFDQISVAGLKREYFNGIIEPLKKCGADVVTVRVPPAASIEKRAQHLADAIAKIDAPRVNIIAHSMGGLDARYAIASLGLHARVASLTTIGTPHAGTPLADIGTSLLGERLMLKKLAKALSLDVDAFWEMTTARMKELNEKLANMHGVAYGSVIGACTSSMVHPMLLLTHKYLSGCVGENDGLVPASSQEWGDVLLRVDADHWAQIGWGVRFDASVMYVNVVDELIARGF
jgi:triacylglycerol lipase